MIGATLGGRPLLSRLECGVRARRQARRFVPVGPGGAALRFVFCGAALLAALLFAGPARSAAPQVPTPPAPKPVRTTTYSGDVELKVIVHEWRTAGVRRRVFVLLPPDYTESGTRRYPVLYALDGQDLFDAALAAGKEEWTLDEILARQPEGLQEMLVVAVETAGDVHELSPPGAEAQAHGDSLLDFLVDTVRPFVESTYPVRTGRGNATLLGLGRSALFATWAAWVRADLFGGAIALDCPDLDATSVAWTAAPPRGGRPWFWYEQRATEKARPSSTDVIAALSRQAEVQVVVAGTQSNRTLRLLTALRAWSQH